MYMTSSNEKIAKYIFQLIKKRGFKSERQFCKEYLIARGEPTDSVHIQNMATRMNAIKTNKNGLQLDDLPIFASLLGVSVDDILSAGSYHAPAPDRVTNYSVAFSKDKKEWKAFLDREDKLFLNPDEYNKNLIDYAIEAENYPLLKYLVKEGIVWFVGDEKDECYLGGFGAGTCLKRRDFTNLDLLNYNMKYQDDLRIGMISLALKKNDFDMLTVLKARELPVLYTLNFLSAMSLKPDSIPSSYNIDLMIKLIAESSEQTLSYFFDTFDVEPKYGSVNTFICPFAGKILDLMIKKSNGLAGKFVKRALSYNQSVLKKLNDSIEKSIASLKELHSNQLANSYYRNTDFREEALRDYKTYVDGTFIFFRASIYIKEAHKLSFLTNIIQVTASSKDPSIQFYIDEINDTCKQFIAFEEEKNA